MAIFARRQEVAAQTEAFGDLSAYETEKRRRYAGYSWSEVTYFLCVGLGYNLLHGVGPQTYWQLFGALNLTIINQVLASWDAPNALFRPGQYLLIELVHLVLGVTVKYLLIFLQHDRSWAQGVFHFGVRVRSGRIRRGQIVRIRFRPHVPEGSAVSMFKAKIPPHAYAEALELLKYQLLELVHADELTDAFILDCANDRIFGRLHVPDGLCVQVGFDLFLQFVVWHGAVAQIEYARGYRVWLVNPEGSVVGQEHRHAPRPPNAVPLRQLILLYFQRLRLDADNAAQLAAKLDTQGDPDTETPSAQLIHRFLDEVNPEIIQQATHQLIRRFRHRGGDHPPLIGIDSTLLEVSKRYQDAEWLYDPKSRRRMWAYKLYVMMNLSTGAPIGFVLGNDPHLVSELLDDPDAPPRSFKDNKGGLLMRLRIYIRQVIDACRGIIFLFDKGFFNGNAFYELVQDDAHFVTPGKKVKPIDQIEQTLQTERFHPLEGGQRQDEQIAHTSVSLSGYQGALRLIVTRYWGKILLTDAKGNPLCDADGNKRFGQGWIYHSYLTDVPADQLSPEDVVETYRKRWGVENWIQRLRADWALRCFPSTRLRVVKVHLHLVLMSYLLFVEFRRLFGKRYAGIGLSRFRNVVFQMPIERLAAQLPHLFAEGDYPTTGPTNTPRITRRAIDHQRLARIVGTLDQG